MKQAKKVEQEEDVDFVKFMSINSDLAITAAGLHLCKLNLIFETELLQCFAVAPPESIPALLLARVEMLRNFLEHLTDSASGVLEYSVIHDINGTPETHRDAIRAQLGPVIGWDIMKSQD